jgi:hypothetical protein
MAIWCGKAGKLAELADHSQRWWFSATGAVCTDHPWFIMSANIR